eukprot:scaffold7349_cov173-Amphora_coffeaeformis.AAC.15
MGPSPPLVAIGQGETTTRLGGCAIMSTHPRDFARILHLSETLPLQAEQNEREESLRVVPCFGIHPWWLAELTDKDWAPSNTHSDDDADPSPEWLQQMETMLTENPNSIVGEIGLDGFHFDPDTHELACPMETQVNAFELQMQLAARLQRPVSIHTVQCFGPLMNALSRLKKQGQLPPRMYFHAFGGKVGTVDQVLALCGRKRGQVYFGFAPVVSECIVALSVIDFVSRYGKRCLTKYSPLIWYSGTDFRAPKTAQVMLKVGLERLVLETDHEDSAFVQESIQQCISFIAETFGVDEKTVIETTTGNANALYGLS